MFLVRRPSSHRIDRFLRESQDLPLSYGPIGIVKADTVRQDVDETTVAIGHGMADFERARAAVIAWRQFNIGWVEAFPRRGEELFEVFSDPIVRQLQARFRRHSAEAMKRVTGDNGTGLRGHRAAFQSSVAGQ